MEVYGNRTLVVSTINASVFELVNVANKVLGVRGRDFEILRVLSSKMKFKYVLVTPNDGEWGDCDDKGYCYGLIGMVMRHEADMAIAQITSTASRAKYVDFSSPYFQDEVTFITKNIEAYEEVNSLFFIEPFDKRVWIFLTSTLLLYVSLIKILKYFQILRTEMMSVQTMLAIILRQGVNWQWHRDKLSVVATLLVFVVTAGCTCKLYEIVLASSTTLTPVTPPIDTISDMVDAIKNRDYFIHTKIGNAYDRVLKTSKLEYMKIFAQSTINRKFEAPKTIEEGIWLMLHEKFAQVAARSEMTSLFIKMNQSSGTFHFAKETLFAEHIAVAVNKNFPSMEDLNKWLSVFVASGLIEKWNFDDVTFLNQSTSSNEDASSYIAMNDLKFIFVALLCGYLSGFVCLLVEMMTNYCHNHLPIGSI